MFKIIIPVMFLGAQKGKCKCCYHVPHYPEFVYMLQVKINGMVWILPHHFNLYMLIYM